MIQKKEKYFNFTIGSSKLYLEDVEKIISKLKTEGVNVEISDDESVYESIEELKSITEKKHELNFYEKNTDNLLLGILASTIIIIIEVIITYYKSK